MNWSAIADVLTALGCKPDVKIDGDLVALISFLTVSAEGRALVTEISQRPLRLTEIQDEPPAALAAALSAIGIDWSKALCLLPRLAEAERVASIWEVG